MSQALTPRRIGAPRRVVIKIGTNVLSKGMSVDEGYLRDIARQVRAMRDKGAQVIIVTSGAIGMGAGELHFTEKPKEVALRQACAAVGQPLLMQCYRDAFRSQGIAVSQILVTADLLSRRQSFLNLKTAVDAMLRLGVVPVFNENDVVSVAEIDIAFGDNDRLSAYVASKIDADLLFILTDIDALYDADPRYHPEAKPIRTVARITTGIVEAAGAAGSAFSTGGMRTKIKAVQIAEKAGCPVILAHGREDSVLLRALSGEEIGTLFLAQKRLKSRTRWLLNGIPAGKIEIDPGALTAIRARNSLLPSGVVSVEGAFGEGDIVLANGVVKLATRLSSDEIRMAMGKHTSEGEKLLGKRDLIARPEDMVFLDEEYAVPED
jgi:glutamate 5-kinase